MAWTRRPATIGKSGNGDFGHPVPSSAFAMLQPAKHKERPLLASVPACESGCSVQPGRRYTHPPAYSVLAGVDRAPRVHRPPHRSGFVLGLVRAALLLVKVPMDAHFPRRQAPDACIRYVCWSLKALPNRQEARASVHTRTGTGSGRVRLWRLWRDNAGPTEASIFASRLLFALFLDSRGHTLGPSSGKQRCAHWTYCTWPRKLCCHRGATVHRVHAQAWTRRGAGDSGQHPSMKLAGTVFVAPAPCAYMIGRARSQNHQIGCRNVSSQPKRLFLSLDESNRTMEHFSVPARLTEGYPRCTTRRVSQPICWGTEETNRLIGHISASSSSLAPRTEVGGPGCERQAIGACWRN
ncbi:hypothetical protein V8C35DRAFT_179278 [Trichoderma chlorosporum]